jgi:hypothetical protein
MLHFIGPVLNVFWISSKQSGCSTFNVAGLTLWQGNTGVGARKDDKNLTTHVMLKITILMSSEQKINEITSGSEYLSYEWMDSMLWVLFCADCLCSTI